MFFFFPPVGQLDNTFPSQFVLLRDLNPESHTTMSALSSLGLSCPTGGSFYICQNNATEFIGCCTTNPCANGSGECPKANLRPTSFSGDAYGDIPPQQCAGNDKAALFYTCMHNVPPFLGCCTSNPCASGSCPSSRLSAAKLSTDPAARAAFVTEVSPPQAPPQPPSTETHSGGGLPTGAIVGIAVGGALVVFAVIGLVMYRCGWLARKRKERQTVMAQGYAKTPESGASPFLKDHFCKSRHKIHLIHPYHALLTLTFKLPNPQTHTSALLTPAARLPSHHTNSSNTIHKNTHTNQTTRSFPPLSTATLLSEDSTRITARNHLLHYRQTTNHNRYPNSTRLSCAVHPSFQPASSAAAAQYLALEWERHPMPSRRENLWV